MPAKLQAAVLTHVNGPLLLKQTTIYASRKQYTKIEYLILII